MPRGARRPRAPSPADPPPAPAAPTPSGPTGYLLKTEPATYSIDTLASEPNMTGTWDGVRNRQARNVLAGMPMGSKCFLYHSSCKQPAIVGVVEVVKEAYPDPTAPPGTPWVAVDVRLVRRLQRPILLAELKASADPAIQRLPLLRQARLSVMLLPPDQWAAILRLEGNDHVATTVSKD